MKAFFLIIIACVYSFCGIAQPADVKPVHGTDIPLCCGLDSPSYEYSGLARWNGNVLLVPQYPGKWENAIFAVNDKDIDKAIAGKYKTGVPYTRITISNLADFKSRMKGTYQGFEGAVVVGNTIYFTLEFSESTCYLLKGYIRSQKGRTTIALQKMFAIEKPEDAYVNAGYESIGYLPGSKVIYVFFEKNSPEQPSVAMVDTSFGEHALTYGTFERPMFFRLTDVAAGGPHSFIGINHYFNDYQRKQKEYSYYVGDANKAAAGQQMFGADPAAHNYTAVVELTQKGTVTEWQTRKFISYGDENWEGIVPFRKGFLMVVDEYPRDGSPRMRYFEW